MKEFILIIMTIPISILSSVIAVFILDRLLYGLQKYKQFKFFIHKKEENDEKDDLDELWKD